MIAQLESIRSGGDTSLPLAVAALLKVADASGRAEFDGLAVAYREDFLELQRREFGETGLQRGTLSVDEVRRYLKASVLPRLVGANIVAPPADDGGGGADVVLTEAVRAGVATVIPEVRDELLESALEALRAAEAPVERVVAGGSTLKAQGLVKSYRRRRVVDDVSLEVREGEIVGLLGPNGAGKTTTFYMIVGLVRPEAGRISLDQHEISILPMYRRARMGIGYLAQEPSIFRKLTVEENVLAILETLRLPRSERDERLESLLNDLSIAHLRDAKAYKLSGGERRRLEITRALVTDPKFLLLDEPFTGVDPIAVSDIQTIVAGLRRRGIGVLITDHNVEQTLDIVHRAYIMFEGRVQVAGTVRELVFNDQVADLYLGPTLTERLRERLGAAA
jgi:lipopolysaccharide export system ATP-binding protein